MYLSVKKKKIAGIHEIIPMYWSLLIFYNPLEMSFSNLVKRLKKIENVLDKLAYIRKAKFIKIPVLFGGKHKPDLVGYVAECNNLSVEEVIKIQKIRIILLYDWFSAWFCLYRRYIKK